MTRVGKSVWWLLLLHLYNELGDVRLKIVVKWFNVPNLASGPDVVPRCIGPRVLRMLLLLCVSIFFRFLSCILKFSVFLFVPFWLVFWVANEDFVVVLPYPLAYRALLLHVHPWVCFPLSMLLYTLYYFHNNCFNLAFFSFSVPDSRQLVFIAYYLVLSFLLMYSSSGLSTDVLFPNKTKINTRSSKITIILTANAESAVKAIMLCLTKDFVGLGFCRDDLLDERKLVMLNALQRPTRK